MEPVLHVAVVGSGPAGLYATDALTQGSEPRPRVDVFDRLPTPFGLLRYGVAPDHLKMKSLEAGMQRILARDGVRFFGNVEFGRDVTRAELLASYGAVIYANGAARDRRIGIAGEELAGSVAATDFVAWYNGHPAAVCSGLKALDAGSVAVIGVGNVALDLARILAKPAADFRPTDMPAQALDVLRSSTVRDVYILGRRSAAHAKFTSKELRELGELSGVDIIVDPADVEVGVPGEQLAAADANVAKNLDILRGWAARPAGDAPRRIHICFNTNPTALLGAGRVEAIRLERMLTTAAGSVLGSGSFSELPVQLVLRSVGYRGESLLDVPFDESAGIIPSRGGRVLHEDGTASNREYVTGWARRGPQGVLGNNKSDAAEVAAAVLADSAARIAHRSTVATADLLQERGVHHVDLQGWLAIVAAERIHGSRLGRSRVKLSSREELLLASRPASG
jgi:ferredoxin--NADP+ reductase